MENIGSLFGNGLVKEQAAFETRVALSVLKTTINTQPILMRQILVALGLILILLHIIIIINSSCFLCNLVATTETLQDFDFEGDAMLGFV